MLATPRRSGTILPGITRDSILHLARAWGGCDVEERAVTIEEVRQVNWMLLLESCSLWCCLGGQPGCAVAIEEVRHARKCRVGSCRSALRW